MVYHHGNTAILQMENGRRLLLSEGGSTIAEQQMSNDKLLWHHSTIPEHIALQLLESHHREYVRLGVLGAEAQYLVFNYRNLFHVLSELYDDKSDIRKYSGVLYSHNAAQLDIGQQIQHGIDVAISGSDVGACGFCHNAVHTPDVRGWSIGVALAQPQMRFHRYYGDQSVAINPICKKCNDEQVYIDDDPDVE